MDYSKVETLLQNNIKEFNIKLDSGDIDIILISPEYCKRRNWRLLYFVDSDFFYEKLTNIVSSLKKLKIDKLNIFLYTDQDMEIFDAKISQSRYIGKGVYYYKSVKLNEIEDIDLYPDNLYKNVLDIYSMSMIITNDLVDFIIFVNEEREDFYFYGEENFLFSILKISKKEYEKYFQGIIQNTYSLLFKDYLKWLWKNCITRKL